MTINDILTSHRTGQPVVMGILNVTPDSFSDGGEFFDPSAAVTQTQKMIADGADIIDIGAESTRPGSRPIGEDEQIDRLRNILPAIANLKTLVSIDTTSSKVASFALDAGATIINVISAGRDDPEILTLSAKRNVPIILMHMLGQPKTMQDQPHYDNVVTEVRDFLANRIDAAESAGIPRKHCIVDPGIGFGKLLEHNLALLAGVKTLLELDCPVLIGPSRKRFIGELTGTSDPHERISGTVASCIETLRQGATIFRVHDVAELVSAIKVAQAIWQNLST